MANQEKRDRDVTNRPDANPDPITGAPGSHPVGTGVGAAGGGAAGAAIGAAVSGPAAPVGAAVGAVIGAVAGGLAGKGVAESVNPTTEEEYWRNNYSSRPYAAGVAYDEFAPAYRYGWESKTRYADRSFEDAENDLSRDWNVARGKSQLEWEKAKQATRDAWDRIERNSKSRSGGKDAR